jgi:NAD(P)-dependent dehydrogenase (short-subunit alcohol dehydrogenase family)
MLAGRAIAVVGGAGGIGRAVVARLLREDARVAVIDLPASLERHPPPPSTLAIPVDLMQPDSVTAAAAALHAAFPRLDGCVNLAGFHLGLQPLTEMTDAAFATTLDGNLTGVLRWARAVIPALSASGEGALVHVASGLAQHIRPGYGAYSAAKAGLIAISKTLAQECAPALRVNVVAPGAIETAFLQGGTGRSAEQGPGHIDRDAYVRALPLRRFGAPEDVVGPIVFLLGPDSAYMTGQVLWVNAGGYMP